MSHTFSSFLILFIIYFLLLLKTVFIYFRWSGREKERERNINLWLPLSCPPIGNLACNTGTCPDCESNRRPFGSQAGAQSTEPHQPGLFIYFEREREKHQFVVPLVFCIPWLLYVPWSGIKPATLVHRYDSLTNRGTWPRFHMPFWIHL